MGTSPNDYGFKTIHFCILISNIFKISSKFHV